MSEPPVRRRYPFGRPPTTRLERSLRPSCLLTAIVLVGVVILFRVRLPPLPYSLLVVAGLGLLCFLVVYLWQSGRQRGP